MTVVSGDNSGADSVAAARRDHFGEGRNRESHDDHSHFSGSGSAEAHNYDYMRDLNPVDLVRTLSTDATALLVDEVTLAKKEGLQALGDIRKSIIAVIVAGITLFAGTLFLMQSATYGLAQIMPFWMASLIVGGVITLIGLMLVLWARNLSSPDNLKPENVAETLAKDKNMLAEHAS